MNNRVRRINTLKNFGIFHDYSWKVDIPEFKKFNLIYGWNRSGKTTISRVFASCEKKCCYDDEMFEQYPENGKFELSTVDNTKINDNNVSTNELPVKVFNQDFIDENISFEPSGSSKPIIYVSEEDIKSKKELEKLKESKPVLDQKLHEAEIIKQKTIEIKNNFLTGLGREVANILFDKSYNKTKAENKINEIGVDNFRNKILVDKDRSKYETISKSEPEESLRKIEELPSFDYDLIFQKVKSLLQKEIVSELLERLKDPDDIDGGLDEELNSWVKQGFDIHKAKNQFGKCLFCENSLTSNFFEALSGHFSRDYEDLQNSIESLIKALTDAKLTKISEKNTELYSDLRNNYEVKAKEYNEIVEQHNRWLLSAKMWLEQKYKNPFDPDIPEMVTAPEDHTYRLNEIINELNEVLISHNRRIENHAKEVQGARKNLELHAIAMALVKQDYKKIIDDLKTAESTEKEALADVSENVNEISKLERKNSNVGKAVGEINMHLKGFFGREELKLELAEDKKGYIIKRDRKPAKNLSEGEKTAIAFSYFIVKVEEKEFKIKEGVIFIDDPISSFDSNNIYHCFSLISNHFKEVGQLFISTHNFQLFNLVKEWFINKNNHMRKDNQKASLEGREARAMPCEFFMVENFIDEHIRMAKLVELDKTLRDYRSEYHFLFSLLNKFKDVDFNYSDFYTIGNVARRFFDIFADFKVPDSRDQKQKMQTIVREFNDSKESADKMSDLDWNKAYKLVNEFSHNYDPTAAIEHKDKSESKDAIKVLLKIVEEADPSHFKVLAKSAR